MKYLFAAIFYVCIISCFKTDLQKEKIRLLAAYKADRKAVLLSDFTFLKEARTDSFLTIRDSDIIRLDKNAVKDSFQHFFKSGQYENWDDMQQPIISISNDGTMAWIIFKIYVRRARQNDRASITQDAFVYTGITTYVKQEGKWVQTSTVFGSRKEKVL